jgi:UDP-N-acetylglucosamine 4,6-dehydratase/5-epimerase
MLSGADVLVTGGTGSFGNLLIRHLIAMDDGPRRVIIFSRDEFKQHDMARAFDPADRERLRFFLGDVRDFERLRRAFCGVDYVFHAAALKQVPACEYNPMEAVKTNVIGAQNVIEAAIDMGVKKVIALSTDKACNPANLYGATKLCSEKLFTAAGALAGSLPTSFSVVRYGNVIGSRGSVIPLFRKQADAGEALTITDPRMTRFWISLPQAVSFVLGCIRRMEGGEVFVPKLPSVNVTTLAQAIEPDTQRHSVTGIRPGEKLHETLVGDDESHRATGWHDRYVICQEPSAERALPAGFTYRSDTNPWQLGLDDVREMLRIAA